MHQTFSFKYTLNSVHFKALAHGIGPLYIVSPHETLCRLILQGMYTSSITDFWGKSFCRLNLKKYWLFMENRIKNN